MSRLLGLALIALGELHIWAASSAEVMSTQIGALGAVLVIVGCCMFLTAGAVEARRGMFS